MDMTATSKQLDRERDLWLLSVGAAMANKAHLDKLRARVEVRACPTGEVAELVSAVYDGKREVVWRWFANYDLPTSESVLESMIERLALIHRGRQIRNHAEKITLASAAGQTELIEEAAQAIAAIVKP